MGEFEQFRRSEPRRSGVKTSVYLTADLAAAVKASGTPLAELIRRGLSAWSPEEASARLAAEAVRGDVREMLGAVAADAVRGAHDDAQESLGEIVDRAVRSALRDAQGGHL